MHELEKNSPFLTPKIQFFLNFSDLVKLCIQTALVYQSLCKALLKTPVVDKLHRHAAWAQRPERPIIFTSKPNIRSKVNYSILVQKSQKLDRPCNYFISSDAKEP